jgi:tRNA A-37 threonylcarbamoyl transferase component Bud32
VWHGGNPRYSTALEPLVRSLLGKGDGVELLREKPGRRRLARAVLPSGEPCFLKHFVGERGSWKRRLGLTPAAREFRALRRLSGAGVPVPEVLAYFEADPGGEIVVTRFLEGEPLGAALGRPREARWQLLRQVGALVAGMHAAGVIHRDLHGENIWVTSSGPVLIDLQQALPLGTRSLRLRDLGELDSSTSPLLSLADRVRLRAACLGLSRPFQAQAREALRAVGRASRRRRRAHVESRTRRSLREGRLYVRFHCAQGRGMRLRSQAEDDLCRALETSPDVPRFHTPAWRPGSPARDAWLAGHGLRARGIGAPLPLAFVERRALPGGVSSALVMEPCQALRWEARPEDPEAWLDEVLDLGVALRRHHVAIAGEAGLLRDGRGALGPDRLEQVRFRARLDPSQAQRIDALVDRAIAASGAAETERAAALRRYARRLAFYDDRQAAETVTQRK